MGAEIGVQAIPNGGWDERVRVFRCGTTVDSFAIVTDRWLIIVDTLVSQDAAAQVMAELRPLLTGDRRLLVINTHADWDHVWGNGLFGTPGAPCPAPIIGHTLSAARMRSPEAAELLARMQADHPARYATASWAGPTILFDAGLEIDGGDLRIVLIPTPGHTEDHVSIWVPAIRLLLAGDAAEAPIPSVESPASLTALRASLERLAALGAETALYCHASGMRHPHLITRNLAYFSELEQRCQAVLQQGKPPLGEPARELMWPLEKAVPDLLPPAEQLHFYRDVHDSAIRAMVAWLTESAS